MHHGSAQEQIRGAANADQGTLGNGRGKGRSGQGIRIRNGQGTNRNWHNRESKGKGNGAGKRVGPGKRGMGEEQLV